MNLHLDPSATMCFVSRRGLGKAKHVDIRRTCGHRRLPKQGDSSPKKVGTNVNPADLMTKPLAKPKIEQLMGIMGDEFLGIDVDSLEGRSTGV